ncbi:2-succinylbenzoate--CoA ligase, partial [Haemophilus influenzae]
MRKVRLLLWEKIQ